MPQVRRRRAAQRGFRMGASYPEPRSTLVGSGTWKMSLLPKAQSNCATAVVRPRTEGTRFGWPLLPVPCQDCRYRRGSSASLERVFRKALQGPDPPERRHSNRVERRTFTPPVLCPIEFDALDPVWWTSFERGIRCPDRWPTQRSDVRVASSPMTSKPARRPTRPGRGPDGRRRSPRS